MSDPLLETVYNPDVLSCLANLSNDEVFTPPDVANKMLDMLPQDLFRDPNTTFLDPACKSGVFLREIAKRLLVGLAPQIPDLQQRIDHIFHKQLFGIAITELTSLLSRRSTYCTKYPNGQYSVSHFDTAEGNIRYKTIQHTWKGGKCVFCGASQSEYDRSPELETHAYEWIHTQNPEEIFKMKFDVIIGNPPYQLSDGGGGAGKSSTPIYQKFVMQSIKLSPRYLSMIIPSRWFNGGKGLDDFREKMLNDDRISYIVDYMDSKTCFTGVDIPGGICYFLWDKNYHDHCNVTNITGGYESANTDMRPLNEFATFVRQNRAVNIVHKVQALHEDTMECVVSSRKPFGLESNQPFDNNGDVILRSSEGIGKILKSHIPFGIDLIYKWKAIVSKVSFEHAGVPDKSGTMRVLSVVQKLPPNSACTESYLVAYSSACEKDIDHCIGYLRTKFARFLIAQMLASMNMSKSTYRFVPIQDFSKSWTDAELYAKYNLTQEEIDFIESMIKPMNLDDTNEN